MTMENLTSTYDATDDVRFGGPDCGVDGCQRERGHIGDHRRVDPRRIQRKRTKGWRMPEGAVYVGRPTAYGNPFPIQGEWITGAARSFGYPTGPAFLRGTAVALYRWWLTGNEPVQGIETPTGYRVEITEGSLGGAAWIPGLGFGVDLPVRPDLAPLRGRDLACWCPVDDGFAGGTVASAWALLIPCHADVLLELANP